MCLEGSGKLVWPSDSLQLRHSKKNSFYRLPRGRSPSCPTLAQPQKGSGPVPSLGVTGQLEFTPWVAEQLRASDTSGCSILFYYVVFSSLEIQFPYLRTYSLQSCFPGLREAGSIKASYDFLACT